MSESINHAAADAAASRAVEEAWDKWQNAIPPKMPLGRRQDGIHFTPHHLLLDCGSAKEAFIAASEHLLAARRAARDAGYVEVMVSKEAVEALRAYLDGGDRVQEREARDLLARDLGSQINRKS